MRNNKLYIVIFIYGPFTARVAPITIHVQLYLAKQESMLVAFKFFTFETKNVYCFPIRQGHQFTEAPRA